MKEWEVKWVQRVGQRPDRIVCLGYEEFFGLILFVCFLFCLLVLLFWSFHFISQLALSVWKLVLQTRLASNSQRSTCLASQVLGLEDCGTMPVRFVLFIWSPHTVAYAGLGLTGQVGWPLNSRQSLSQLPSVRVTGMSHPALPGFGCSEVGCLSGVIFVVLF